MNTVEIQNFFTRMKETLKKFFYKKEKTTVWTTNTLWFHFEKAY